MATTKANKKAPKGAEKNKQPAAKRAAGKKVQQKKERKSKQNKLTLKTLMMKAQFITDGSGKKIAVVLPVKTFEKMLEDLEELEDIRLYDEAERHPGKGVPMMEAFKRIEGKRKKV
jgi:plasmid maintenance system killer protein